MLGADVSDEGWAAFRAAGEPADAGAGARAFLAGRTAAPLDRLAEDIRASGGEAEPAVADALDEAAVNAFVDDVAARAGRIDISFNAIGYGDIQQPLMEISVGDYLQPVATALRSQFLTTRAAARYMTARGSGVVLAFGGGGPQTLPGLGGFKIALDALEGRTLTSPARRARTGTTSPGPEGAYGEQAPVRRPLTVSRRGAWCASAAGSRP